MSYVSYRNFKGFLAELNENAKEHRVFDEVRVMISEEHDVIRHPTLTANLGRVIKLLAISACLKVFTWRTAIKLMPEILCIATLSVGCSGLLLRIHRSAVGARTNFTAHLVFSCAASIHD